MDPTAVAKAYGDAVLTAIDAMRFHPAIPQTQVLRFVLALQESLLPLLEQQELQVSAATLIAKLASRGHEALVRKDEADQAVSDSVADSIGRLLSRDDQFGRSQLDAT